MPNDSQMSDNKPNNTEKVPLKEHINEKIIALKEYVDVRFGALQDYIDANITRLKEQMDTKLIGYREYIESRLTSLENATAIVAANIETRFQNVNEFRGQLKDQSATFITRAEHEALIKKFDDDIKNLRDANFIRRPEYEAALSKVEDDVKILRESKANLEGKASQQSVYGAYAISVLGIILTIYGLIREFYTP